MPKKISIFAKLTATFLFFIGLIAAIVIYASNITAKEAMRAELIKMASMAASMVDGDVLVSLKPGDEKSTKFLQMRDMLLRFQKSHRDIQYVYTYKYHSPQMVQFLVDAEYGKEENAATLGQIYKETSVEMFEGLKKPVAESKIKDDAWGSFLSGYAPVYDKKGKVAGAVGVDMTSQVVAYRQKIMGIPAYIAVLAVLVLGLVVIGWIALAIIKDLNKLTNAAKEMASGNAKIKTGIKRNDEIGELADAFELMSCKVDAVLEFMRANKPQKKKGKKS